MLKARVVENAPDDLCPDSLFVMGLVDDHIPNRCPVHEVGQHAAESDELITIPCAEDKIRLPQHLVGLFRRTIFSPGSLAKQPNQLRSGWDLFRKSHDRLEGWRHLVLK